MTFNSPVKSIVLVLAVAVGIPVIGQDWTVYDMSNSPLPSTTVTALVEDPEGGLWVGTDWGLCHFDGDAQWMVYQESNSDLPWNAISTLDVDDQGGLWIGTVSGGLAYFLDDQWLTFDPTDSPMPSYGVRDLFVDHRGWVWVATASGLVCITGTEWRIYDDTELSHDGAVLNTNNTNAIAVRPDGLVCLGTFNGGLHYISDGTVTFLTTFQDGFFDNTATDVLFDPVSGARWIATPAGGLLRQQGPPVGGNWYQWNSSIAFPSNAMACIAMDVQHRVWAGTQLSGIIRINTDDSFTQFTMANSGLPDNEVGSIMVASDGSVWAGTVYGGLVHYLSVVGLEEPQSRINGLFPNPVNGQGFNVWRMESTDPAMWELFGPTGKLIQQGSFRGEHLVVPTHGLASGLYLFRLQVDGFVEGKRVLVF
ncbi:MAG: hypothetical protein KBF67_13735 [Flavobacteriales bacterium]|nr:hypothetical protein [Flavobacteriales bacterium]